MTPQDLYCVTFTNEGSKFRAFIGQFLKQKVILISISTPVVRTLDTFQDFLIAYRIQT